jgi:hypothetical protein
MVLYGSTEESNKILKLLLSSFHENDDALPAPVRRRTENVTFIAERDLPYFPIPFKETETAAALKALEASTAAALHDPKVGHELKRLITVDLEKTTAFLFQAYLATVGGLGKLDAGVKKLLKGTDHSNSSVSECLG